MEALLVRGGIAPTFLTSALDGGEWSAWRLGRALPSVKDWMGHVAGLDSQAGKQ
jgi:hypothetical protein